MDVGGKSVGVGRGAFLQGAGDRSAGNRSSAACGSSAPIRVLWGRPEKNGYGSVTGDGEAAQNNVEIIPAVRGQAPRLCVRIIRLCGAASARVKTVLPVKSASGIPSA